MLCFRMFPVAINSLDNKGGVSRFSVEKFCFTMPKTFARKLFCVVFHETSGIEKDYG